MQIKNLSNTDLEEIVFAILISFEGYFVSMPSDNEYWAKRYKSARVDYSLSFGMFDGENLIGFIIHGIDEREGILTAFNTGTGVAPSYRGQAIVDQLYKYAFPILKERGIQKCALEVVQENARAIRVYERIGFNRTKDYRCFKGKLASSTYKTSLQKILLSDINNPQHHFYSWDNCKAAMLATPTNTYEQYEVFKEQKAIGFFIINPQSGYLPQFEIHDSANPSHWQDLFDGIAQINRSLKIINVDARRTKLLEQLDQLALENNINQYEMDLIL